MKEFEFFQVVEDVAPKSKWLIFAALCGNCKRDGSSTVLNLEGIPKALEEDEDEDGDEQEVEATAQALRIVFCFGLFDLQWWLQAVANEMAAVGLKPADAATCFCWHPAQSVVLC